MTGGRGPDACIDAVGLEAHGTGVDALYDRVKTLRCISRPIGRMRCGKRFWPAAKAAPFPSGRLWRIP